MSNLRTKKLVVFTTLHNPGIDVSIIVTIKYNSDISVHIHVIDLSTARPKWRLDGPALSGHLLYSLVNNAYANRYQQHLVR